MKSELRALNLGSQKRKWNDHGASSESVAQKKPIAIPSKSHPAISTDPCAKCGRTNHPTVECRVDANKCMWCRSHNHSIGTCLRRQKTIEKGVIRSLALPCQGTLPPSRISLHDEQKGSCNFWYDCYWWPLFKFKGCYSFVYIYLSCIVIESRKR